MGRSQQFLRPMGGESYLLQDDFRNALAAGSVNGTAAVPGPGTRVDVNGNVAISSGALVIDSTTDIYYLSDAITRGAGVTLVAIFTAAAAGDFDVVSFGFDDAKTAGPDRLAFELAGSDVLNVIINGAAVAVGAYTGQTRLELAITLKTSGAKFYRRTSASGVWEKVYETGTNDTATLYGGIGGTGGAPAVNALLIRVPRATWLDMPLMYDTFTRADGAIGTSETTGPDAQIAPARAWAGGPGWAVSSAKAANTPTPGVDVLAGWDFTSGWDLVGAGAVVDADTYSSTGIGGVAKPDALTVGQWYQVTYTRTVSESTSGVYNSLGTINLIMPYGGTARYRAVTTQLYLRSPAANTVDVTTLSAQILAMSDLISVVDVSTPWVIMRGRFDTMAISIPVGVILCCDNEIDPQNYILCWRDTAGANLVLDKVIGGVPTTLINTAVTQVAGAPWEVHLRQSGTSMLVRLYYDNALVGTEQTLTLAGDAAIIGNTKHGLFDTGGNFCRDVELWATGANGEYSILNRWSQDG